MYNGMRIIAIHGRHSTRANFRDNAPKAFSLYQENAANEAGTILSCSPYSP